MKWQIDVKYVPKVCKSIDIPKDKNFYQYTCIDEATYERFYSFLTFYSLEDLRKQGNQYLKRSNNIPMAVSEYKTPIEKRNELILVLLAKYIPFNSLVND